MPSIPSGGVKKILGQESLDFKREEMVESILRKTALLLGSAISSGAIRTGVIFEMQEGAMNSAAVVKRKVEKWLEEVERERGLYFIKVTTLLRKPQISHIPTFSMDYLSSSAIGKSKALPWPTEIQVTGIQNPNTGVRILYGRLDTHR